MVLAAKQLRHSKNHWPNEYESTNQQLIRGVSAPQQYLRRQQWRYDNASKGAGSAIPVVGPLLQALLVCDDAELLHEQ